MPGLRKKIGYKHLLTIFQYMVVPKCLWLVLSCTLLVGCGNLRNSAKTALNDGFYVQKTGHAKHWVYVDVEDSLLVVRPATLSGSKRLPDMLTGTNKYPLVKNESSRNETSFSKPSFDVDILTIPLKFRFATKQVPPQLNANLNGAVYLGYRNDRYSLSYTPRPIGGSGRVLNHYGFSLGFFTGFGSTAVNATTTNGLQLQEYDGVVWTKGITHIIAINNFTVGIALGFDNLFGNDDAKWVYGSKPWLGLALGLNIN